jgi:hypothetical protein
MRLCAAGDRATTRGRWRVSARSPTTIRAWPTRGSAASPQVTLSCPLCAAHENSRFLYRETRRLGWNDGQLTGQLTCPKYVVMEINSRDTITLGFGSALIAAGQYAEADRLLSDRQLGGGDHAVWRHFLHTCLFYVTQRWPDVLSTASAAPALPRHSPTGVELRAATTTMAALAAARRLGATRSAGR